MESAEQPRMISRQHALLYRNKDLEWIIKDEKSLNGVVVNGMKVSEAALRYAQ